jgi:electron transport complex protein RnfC
MLKKSFVGLFIPQLQYKLLPTRLPEPERVTATKTITLYHPKKADQKAPASFHIGDTVKTGQKISLYADDPAYIIASADGTISAISPYAGDFGKTYSAVTIDVDKNETIDDQFAEQCQTATLANALDFLAFTPGNPPLAMLAASENPIKTIVIAGADSDLLVGTRQYITKTRLADLKGGIKILKQITGVERVLLVTARDALQGIGHIGADGKSIDTTYPAALPQMIMKNVLGEVVPAGKSCEDLGVCFMSVEAVVSIGSAYESGQIPVRKVLTLITKEENQRIIETTIGTPIRDILSAYDVTINEADRIIFGGPMTGSAVYSLDQPILPDTDAVMVLDRAKAAFTSDYPCINCGNCVRACPAQMSVNMLVRFLEAGHYQEAADGYDLYSCIECGLCSYVCVSKIPIFQYIRLAKYELNRAKTAEATDA